MDMPQHIECKFDSARPDCPSVPNGDSFGRIFALVKKSVLGPLRFGRLPAVLIGGKGDYVLARVSTPSISVGITAQTHLIALMSLPVLPVIPIVEAKAALPWFGHAQIVLPAQAAWESSAAFLQYGGQSNYAARKQNRMKRDRGS